MPVDNIAALQNGTQPAKRLHKPLVDVYTWTAGAGQLPSVIKLWNKSTGMSNFPGDRNIPAGYAITLLDLRVGFIAAVDEADAATILNGYVLRMNIAGRTIMEAPVFLFPAGVGLYVNGNVGAVDANLKCVQSGIPNGQTFRFDPDYLPTLQEGKAELDLVAVSGAASAATAIGGLFIANDALWAEPF